ncbi:MAG TPA: hypothetical protein VGF95_10495 [Solirubrobacteraceae bacterium]|jgi:hypothetical protein
MNGRDVHRTGIVVLAIAMAAIGLVLIVQAATGDSGVLSGRTLIGVCFLLAGAGRLYVEARRRRRT